MRLILREPPGKVGRVGILGGPWSQAEMLGSGDQVQLLRDPASHIVVTGVEGERGVKGVCGITQVRDGEGSVPTLLPPEVLALPGGSQAVSSTLQPSTGSAQGCWVFMHLLCPGPTLFRPWWRLSSWRGGRPPSRRGGDEMCPWMECRL